MRATLCSALILTFVVPPSVQAHGQMTEPKPRPISAKFRTDAGALRQAGDSELQWSPLEQLSQRKQKDVPEAAAFDVMNGCRGTVYEASNPVTELSVGVEFPIKWFIQAPHPGYGEFNIVKPKTGANGKTKYEKIVTLKRLEPFGTDGGNRSTTVTIPSSVTGCEQAGSCALQMSWHSDVANQTYPTCADIIVKGSGAAAPGGDGIEAPASSDTSTDEVDANADTPATVDSGSSPASNDDEYDTPAQTTSTLVSAADEDAEEEEEEAATPALAVTKTKRKAKVRNLRK